MHYHPLLHQEQLVGPAAGDEVACYKAYPTPLCIYIVHLVAAGGYFHDIGRSAGADGELQHTVQVEFLPGAGKVLYVDVAPVFLLAGRCRHWRFLLATKEQKEEERE